MPLDDAPEQRMKGGKPYPDVDPAVYQLWDFTRAQAEEFYVEAFEEADDDIIRWLARNDRYFLLTCVLRRADARHDWIYARCREVERDPDDHIDLWAREHYKSTLITFAGIIQEIIRDPEITIGIFSHDRKIAKDFLIQIKTEIEDNGFLYDLFPNIFYENAKKEAKTWAEDDGIIVKRKTNPKEATVEAWGLVERMPTGKHFKLRVYDDVVTEVNVTTPDMIKKTTQRFELSEDLGTRGGRVWVVGTRYHYGDTYGVILQRNVLFERRFPATHNGDFDGTPVFLTQEEWERKKAMQSKSTIACQQLLNPIAGEETTLQLGWLRFYNIRPKTLVVYILVDPSKGRTSSSDETACAVIGVDANRNKYLLDGYRHRMALHARWELLVNLYRRWTKMPGVMGVYVGYERFGMQTDDEYFEREMDRSGFSFPIEELQWPREGRMSKIQRIERLEPDFRMGRFHLPHTIEIDEEGRITPFDPTTTEEAQIVIRNNERWRIAQDIKHIDEDKKVYRILDKMIEEYMFFPAAPRDDFLDACSRQYDMDLILPQVYDHDPTGRNPILPNVYADGV